MFGMLQSVSLCVWHIAKRKFVFGMLQSVSVCVWYVTEYKCVCLVCYTV